MRKQLILMFVASMIGGGIATVLMQRKNPFAVWAASGTRAIVLSRDAVCPPGFSDVTSAQNGRYLLADNTVNGAVNQGGSVPPVGTPGGHVLSIGELAAHNHTFNDSFFSENWCQGNWGWTGSGASDWDNGPCQFGSATANSGSNTPHNHPYSGFRLCEWTVN